jgi:hypothetical protein
VIDFAIAVATFLCIAASTWAGGKIREITPVEHLTPDTREIVIAGLGLVSTLAAVVLGLLIDSSKGSFDAINNDIKQLATKVIVLDGMLAQYGPSAAEARTLLKGTVAGKVAAVWPDQVKGGANPATNASVRDLYVSFADHIQRLAAATEEQRNAKMRLQQLAVELAQTYVLMQEERHESVMYPVVGVLLLWLAAIFAGFGLIAPSNHTVRRVLMLCAVSVALSVFLILELDDPLTGVLKASSAPLMAALAQIGP